MVAVCWVLDTSLFVTGILTNAQMMICNFHAKIQFNIIYNDLIKIFKFWLNASYYF